jgi:hypothetical protein
VGGLHRALPCSCAHAPLLCMWEEPGRRESTEERGDLSSVEVGRIDEENKGRDNVRVEADIEKRENTYGRG